MHRKPHSHLAAATRALSLAVTLAVAAQGTVLAAESPDGIRAVFKTQEIGFYYQSLTAFYSCEGIEDKVKRLMLALGANEDVEVEANSCDDGGEIAREISRGTPRSPYVVIRITSPAEATPEVLAELEKTRSQRELKARVRGNRSAAQAAETQFDAQWKPVSLSRGEHGLEPGDCELVSELKKKVLPRLGVRILKDEVKCPPKSINRQQPRLEVEALLPPALPAEGGGAAVETPQP